MKSQDVVVDEYGLSGRNAARCLRINHLILPFKDLMDDGKLVLVEGVDLSYQTEGEQKVVWDVVERQKYKVKPKVAAELRPKSEKLTEKEVREILNGFNVKKRNASNGISLKQHGLKLERVWSMFDANQLSQIDSGYF